jgi:hypothetical protein
MIMIACSTRMTMQEKYTPLEWLWEAFDFQYEQGALWGAVVVDSVLTKDQGVPHTPGFPVGPIRSSELRAAFLEESRIRDHG